MMASTAPLGTLADVSRLLNIVAEINDPVALKATLEEIQAAREAVESRVADAEAGERAAIGEKRAAREALAASRDAQAASVDARYTAEAAQVALSTTRDRLDRLQEAMTQSQLELQSRTRAMEDEHATRMHEFEVAMAGLASDRQALGARELAAQLAQADAETTRDDYQNKLAALRVAVGS